jgi:hypothetical protein
MDIAAYGYETPAGGRSPLRPPPGEDRRAGGWHGIRGAW